MKTQLAQTILTKVRTLSMITDMELPELHAGLADLVLMAMLSGDTEAMTKANEALSEAMTQIQTQITVH